MRFPGVAFRNGRLIQTAARILEVGRFRPSPNQNITPAPRLRPYGNIEGAVRRASTSRHTSTKQVECSPRRRSSPSLYQDPYNSERLKTRRVFVAGRVSWRFGPGGF